MLVATPRCTKRFRSLWVIFILAAGLAAPLVASPQPPAKPTTPPGEEEEEGAPKKPAKRIPVEDPPAQPPQKEKPPMPGGTDSPPPEQEEGGDKGVYVAKIDDIARAASTATDPAVKQYLSELDFAYDLLNDARFKSRRITPIPLLWGKDRFPDTFGIAALDNDDNVGDVESIPRKLVRDIQPFERIALEKTAAFLKPATEAGGPKPADKLAAAERVLTAVMFFHDSARDQNRRRGKNWDEVKTEVYNRLTAIRIDRVKQVAADKDFARLQELTSRLIALYKGNPKVLEPVYAARLAEAEVLVKSDVVTDLEKGAELLNEYEARFPNTGNEASKRVRAALASRAATFLKEVDRIKETDKSKARNLLQTVQAINPDDPTLRQMQKELRTGYAVLVVGTRRLPEFMSPVRARFDSERQAVELMFEGFLEAVPDELTGVRYSPALAAERPRVGAGYRDVPLVRSANWTGKDGGVFNAADVTGTLRLFRQQSGSWAADYVSWLDEPVSDPADPGRLRLRFKMGHLYPQQVLTLKLHPADWLLQRNKQIDDLEFARHPFGTGPFKLHPGYQPPRAGEQRQVVVFVSNSAYARRPGRMAQPAIQEVHFVDVTQRPDLAAEFRGDRLHILTDVPTPELGKYTADGNLGGKVRVVTATRNRRVHLLAVNHRRPALQSVDVRKAISSAIDRDQILNEVYRGGKSDMHKAMTGPFPPGSWATPRTIGNAGLYDRNVAQARFRKYFENPNASATLSLLYPNDDSYAKEACERIKKMVEASTAEDGRKISFTLEAVPPRELIQRVELEHRYDLAYVHHDYRDNWFPLGLGSFLDPTAAGPGGRNYFGYLAKGTNPVEADSQFGALLAECRLHRDYEGKLVDLTHKAHKQFNDQVPFVPLWQLDRHTVIATSVKVYLDGQVEEVNPKLLNPTKLFSSVGRWRVE